MRYVEDGGGYDLAGFVRPHTMIAALAIATEQDYRAVYETITVRHEEWPHEHRRGATTRRIKGYMEARRKPTPASFGVYYEVVKEYLEHLDWRWLPLMDIGSGTRYHLRDGQIPTTGRRLARVSKDLVAVIEGEVRHPYDPTRDGTRAVYGYWSKPT